MELGGVPETVDEYFHLGPIFYVCSSARNWVFFIYKFYQSLACLSVAMSVCKMWSPGGSPGGSP